MAVETNGRFALLGEHSPIDALIPSIVLDFITDKPVDKDAFADDTEGSGWSRVDWVVDEAMKREIVECEGRNRKIIEDSDASELWFGEYGAEWMKRTGALPVECH